jgi:catechol 2,3-dioxygenase-like lactoylglutathione lyase family enzyme
MLGNRNATANIAVKDLAKAGDFYENTLGLKPVSREGDEVIVFASGDTLINVYRSEVAGTNKATAVTWTVGDDIGKLVKALEDKRVPFEHYKWPGMTMDGHIHVMGDMKVAWFKDPEGNILNLINQ